MSKEAKILIIGQPFNDITGGGITLSNLFQGWPKDKIAVAATGHFLYSATTDICDTYYQLGSEEHKWVFPFNLIQRNFNSGLKDFGQILSVTNIRHVSSWRYRIVNHFFYPLLQWLGLMHNTSKIILSKRFRNWLSEYQPNVLYIQVYNRETIRFASSLVSYLNVPSAIHFMDDWPSTICARGFLKKMWQKRINTDLQNLLDKVDIHLSISQAMAEEYEKRYKHTFLPFHNPVDLKMWMRFIKTDFKLDKNNVSILYCGRIGIGIAESLFEVAGAIDKLNAETGAVKLYIQTPTEEQAILNGLAKYRCVRINPVTEYETLPRIMSAADILLLANDFNEEGINYLKYSMPTKASEYMISGTPVFVYAPPSSAVFNVFNRNNCAYCLSSQDINDIIAALNYLIESEDYRKEISQNAVKYAREHFDSQKVCANFKHIFINAVA